MANRRALVFGLLAVTLGLGGAYLNYEWLSQRSPRTVTEVVETHGKTLSVVAAKSGLAAGERVHELQLVTLEWPDKLVPPGAILSLEKAVGRVPRRGVAPGEPLLESALLPVGTDAGLSPIIGEGQRAVAVKVDEVIGIAGFIKPGARVDVLATIRTKSRTESFSKVILQDVGVLAIDQDLEEVPDHDPELVSVVTLEVSPADAQKLTFAAHEGKLQLALRNPADREVVNTSSVNSASLKGAKPTRPRPRSRRSVQVIKGMELSTTKF